MARKCAHTHRHMSYWWFAWTTALRTKCRKNGLALWSPHEQESWNPYHHDHKLQMIRVMVFEGVVFHGVSRHVALDPHFVQRPACMPFSCHLIGAFKHSEPHQLPKINFSFLWAFIYGNEPVSLWQIMWKYLFFVQSCALLLAPEYCPHTCFGMENI